MLRVDAPQQLALIKTEGDGVIRLPRSRRPRRFLARQHDGKAIEVADQLAGHRLVEREQAGLAAAESQLAQIRTAIEFQKETQAAELDLRRAELKQAEARLREFAAQIGQPAYRGGQVARRLWVNPAPSFEAMTELPAAFRVQLEENFEIPRLAVLARQKSTDGTEKFLFRLQDGQAIETALIGREGDVGGIVSQGRLPAYARLDLRANHAFNFDTRRLTLFLEVVNVTARTNYAPTYDAMRVLSNGRAVSTRQRLFPFLPTAGVLVEF